MGGGGGSTVRVGGADAGLDPLDTGELSLGGSVAPSFEQLRHARAIAMTAMDNLLDIATPNESDSVGPSPTTGNVDPVWQLTGC